jgi:excisionase family DNA binding protein
MNDTISRRDRLRAFLIALADLLEPELRAEGLWPTQARMNPLPPPPPPAPTAPSEDHLWDADDVARFLNLSTSWVYKRSAEGVLPTVRLGSALRFIPEDVAAWAGVITPPDRAPPVVRRKAVANTRPVDRSVPAVTPAQRPSVAPTSTVRTPAPPASVLPVLPPLPKPFRSGLSPRQAASQLGLCRATVYKLCETGELPHWRNGANAIQIDPAELARFAQSKRQEANAPLK